MNIKNISILKTIKCNQIFSPLSFCLLTVLLVSNTASAMMIKHPHKSGRTLSLKDRRTERLPDILSGCLDVHEHLGKDQKKLPHDFVKKIVAAADARKSMKYATKLQFLRLTGASLDEIKLILLEDTPDRIVKSTWAYFGTRVGGKWKHGEFSGLNEATKNPHFLTIAHRLNQSTVRTIVFAMLRSNPSKPLDELFDPAHVNHYRNLKSGNDDFEFSPAQAIYDAQKNHRAYFREKRRFQKIIDTNLTDSFVPTISADDLYFSYSPHRELDFEKNRIGAIFYAIKEILNDHAEQPSDIFRAILMQAVTDLKINAQEFRKVLKILTTHSYAKFMSFNTANKFLAEASNFVLLPLPLQQIFKSKKAEPAPEVSIEKAMALIGGEEKNPAPKILRPTKNQLRKKKARELQNKKVETQVAEVAPSSQNVSSQAPSRQKQKKSSSNSLNSRQIFAGKTISQIPAYASRQRERKILKPGLLAQKSSNKTASGTGNNEIPQAMSGELNALDLHQHVKDVRPQVKSRSENFRALDLSTSSPRRTQSHDIKLELLEHELMCQAAYQKLIRRLSQEKERLQQQLKQIIVDAPHIESHSFQETPRTKEYLKYGPRVRIAQAWESEHSITDQLREQEEDLRLYIFDLKKKISILKIAASERADIKSQTRNDDGEKFD